METFEDRHSTLFKIFYDCSWRYMENNDRRINRILAAEGSPANAFQKINLAAQAIIDAVGARRVPGSSPAVRNRATESEMFVRNIEMRLERFNRANYFPHSWFNAHKFLAVLSKVYTLEENALKNIWSGEAINVPEKRILVRFLLGENEWDKVSMAEKFGHYFGVTEENRAEVDNKLSQLIDLVPENEVIRKALFAEHNTLLHGKRERVSRDLFPTLAVTLTPRGKDHQIQRVER